MSDNTVLKLSQPSTFSDPLTEVLRSGARSLLARAVEAEVAAFLDGHSEARTEEGRRRLVRHGHLPEREIMTGIGPVAVRAPRVRDRTGQGAERIRFSSALLPPYARRSKSLEVLIPVLYLKGISTGDFAEALAALLGPDAGGLSASTVARLTEVWADEHAHWLKRDLSARHYVYFWADGIHVQARLEDDAQCLLVIIGATPEREAFEAKMAAREKRRGRAKGKHPKPPAETPAANAQSNLSDPDSRLMRKSKQHEYRQAYNAQAAVDAGGSQLIVGARIGQCASDRNELVADIAAIPAVLGRPETVLADNGYANGAEVAALEARGIEVLVSTAAEGRRRTHDFRPAKAPPAVREPKADWLKAMAGKLASEQGRALYKLRRQTVEPVFGVIKAVLGFAGFSLRGLDKVEGEWTLVALAYNCKRLHKLSLAT